MRDDRATLRLAQLTDIHLGPLPAFGPRHWNLKRALGYVNWQRNRQTLHRPETLALITADLAAQAIDHIAITGDLTNIGLPDEHAAAARWLATLGEPDFVSVIPGNHDIYTRLWLDRGVARWQANMASDAYGRALMAKAGCDPNTLFPSVRRIGPVALIGLNSAIPTPPGFAAGRVGARQRADLASLLAHAQADGLCRIVMIHHAPAVERGHHRRGLIDAAAVRAVIASAGAELVIHGHNHRDERREIAAATSSGRPIPVIGAASASAARIRHGEPLARYNVYAIAQKAGDWHIDLTVRGLATPNGAVGELDRQMIRVPRHANS